MVKNLRELQGMIDDLIIRGIKRPHRIPRYILYSHIRKRVPFTYEEVAGGWGMKGVGLPRFTARLYSEVRLLDEAIGSYHAKRSLEIGCGYGRLTPWIAEHSDQHYAIEPESVLLKGAEKMYPHIHFYQAKAQKLPFPSCYFDLCVSWTVLQHIPPKELTRAVTEIKRACAPEAIIILAEGVGKARTRMYARSYWNHTLEEWKDLFSPWKLTWCTERKIATERVSARKGSVDLVMRFSCARTKTGKCAVRRGACMVLGDRK